MRISDWSSDVCSSDLAQRPECPAHGTAPSGSNISISGSAPASPSTIVTVSPRLSGASQAAYCAGSAIVADSPRSEEHTSELQSLMRISYAVFCLKKKTHKQRESERETNTNYK